MMANRKTFANGNMVTAVLDDWLNNNPDFNLVEIAERIGVTKSANCFMSQIRSGRSKLPVSKIMPMAKLLNEDPKPMVMAVMNEYYPELLDAMIASGLVDDRYASSLGNLNSLTQDRKAAN